MTSNKSNQISEIMKSKVLDIIPSYLTNRYGIDYKIVISGEIGLLTIKHKGFLKGKDQVKVCIYLSVKKP